MAESPVLTEQLIIRRLNALLFKEESPASCGGRALHADRTNLVPPGYEGCLQTKQIHLPEYAPVSKMPAQRIDAPRHSQQVKFTSPE